MGETMQCSQILFKDGTLLANRTVVVEANYIVIIGLSGKREKLVPWDSLLAVNL